MRRYHLAFLTGINFAFFLVGLIYTAIIFLRPSLLWASMKVIASITLAGLMLNFFSQFGSISLLTIVPWFLTTGAFYIIFERVEFPEIRFSKRELVFIFLMQLLFLQANLLTDFDGSDHKFYINYAFEIAKTGELTQNFAFETFSYDNIKISPLFNLINAFFLQFLSFFWINTFQVFYFVETIMISLMFFTLFLFCHRLNINTVHLMPLIFLSLPFLSNFPNFSRELPLMIFSCLAVMFTYEKNNGLAFFFAALASLTKVSGVFVLLLLGLNSLFPILATLPLILFQLDVIKSVLNRITGWKIAIFIKNIQESVRQFDFLAIFLLIPAIIATYFDNPRLAGLGFFTLLGHIMLLGFTDTIRYTSVFIPLEIILVAYSIRKIHWKFSIIYFSVVYAFLQANMLFGISV